MKRSLFFLSIIIAFSWQLLARNEQMEALYTQLKLNEVDPARIAHINNVAMQRDTALFHFEDGIIYFFKPVVFNGRNTVTGCIFIGSGSFHFFPTTRIEREQLARFHAASQEQFETEFDMLLLRFADTTFAELSRHATFVKAELSSGVMKEIQHCEDYLYEDRNDDVIWQILLSLLRDPSTGYFHAHVDIPGHDPVFFTYDPFSDEEVVLQKRYSGLSYEKELVNSFHQKGENQRISHREKSSDFFALAKHYEINSTIESSGDFSSTCKVTVIANTETIHFVHFWLAAKLEVDSVLDDDGSPLSFVKDKDCHELLVFLNEPMANGQEKTITISYRGDILDKFFGNFYIKSTVHWYPRIARHRSTYDMTFKTPKQYEFFGIGKKLEEREEGNYTISRWSQMKPVVSSSFNLGPFKKHDIDLKGAPPITVCMSDAARHEIAQILIKEGISIGKNMEKQVGADVANSIHLFQNIFGPYPFEEIYVTEIPYSHGQAFPGLLHLARETFHIKDEWGYEEIFRAHEVSHQWWGVTVGYKTYHDQWLSEAFAQYSGLWYMQWIKKDTKRFFKILDEWKNDIRTNRKYVFGSGAEAGPIWLGYRTSSSLTEGDYHLIVYKKGAYVLHMLRNMLIDLKTMNEDKFTNLLKDFYETYRETDATTDDFRLMVEKHVGQDMDWFFEQWIYGTDIPTYFVSYRTFQQPDGKYVIKLRVRQEEVPEGFKMYVPITIKFKGDQFARLRFTIDKPFEEFSIPSPLKPEQIIFNDFNSVLAEVKYEKFTE